MKNRKVKFLALTMTALMAMSSMPSVALATESVSDLGGGTVSDIELYAASDAYQVLADSVTFYYGDTTTPDFTVTYLEEHVTDEGVTYVPKTTTATVKETTEATCTEPATLVMTVTIDNQTFVSKQFTTAKALGHNYEEIKRQTITYPTHVDAGLAHVWYECSRCDDAYDTDLTLEAQEHVWEDEVTYVAVENIKTDKNGVVVLDENGVPELADSTKDGIYYTEIRCEEYAEDGAAKDQSENKVVYAKKGVYAVIESSKGIADFGGQLLDKYTSPSTQLPLDESKIELSKCTVDGSYVVAYYTNDGKRISDEKIIVKAHHMETNAVAEFKTADDAKQCDVKYENGILVSVTNKSCYLDVNYYEVTHCTAAGCPNKACDADVSICTTGLPEVSRVEKTATPAGDHVINTEAKKAVAELVKAEATYEEFEALAKDAANYIKVSNDTSTCEEAGTATVEYLCKVCKTVVQTETVKVAAKGHVKEAPVRENYTAPTCTAEGSYNAVAYCERCNKVLETRLVKVPRIAHTNEVSVDEYGVGIDDVDTDTTAQIEFIGSKVVIDVDGQMFKAAGKTGSEDVFALYADWYGEEYTVAAQLYTVCDMCEGHKVVLDREADIKIDSAVKQNNQCKPGEITLTAVYTTDAGKEVSVTDTFEYYSTLAEYQGRKTHTPGEAVKENVVEATATTNGSYDEVVYCTVCGTEISRKNVTVNATGDIILPAVTGLTAKTVSMNRVALSWDAVEGAEGYFVIGFGAGRTGSQIAYTTRTAWTDTAADAEEFNFYWVVPFCRNAEGKIVKGELGGYVYALGRVVAATAKVTATATEDGIELSWAAVSGANSYVIMSKTGSNTAPFNASVATDTNVYVDADAASGEVTYYWVYATYTNADGKVIAAGKTSPFAWAIAE